MKLETTALPDNSGALVAIRSENLDAGNTQAFKDAINPVLAANATVLIDMGALKFVDSSGLGALLGCLRIMNNKGGQLRLFAMSKPVRALFELVRMHRIFAIYNTQDEAQAAL